MGAGDRRPPDAQLAGGARGAAWPRGARTAFANERGTSCVNDSTHGSGACVSPVTSVEACSPAHVAGSVQPAAAVGILQVVQEMECRP
jgi:hypothetical protein